eukprot:644170-Pyramimonas_sp.AAC.1
MVRHIYGAGARRFSVIGPAQESAEKDQRSGISQRCPLSPFLFVVLMAVVIHDAVQNLSDAARHQMEAGFLDIVARGRHFAAGSWTDAPARASE